MPRPRLQSIFMIAFVWPLLLFLFAADAHADTVKVDIRYRGFGDKDYEKTGTTTISVLKAKRGGCKYRLEYNDPDKRPSWAINEVAGDQGRPQRYIRKKCDVPSFTVSEATSKRKFEEQTVYYWTKEAREYARTRLWKKPPGWTGGKIAYSTKSVGPDVLKDGFANACWPKPYDGCMRAWPHEGPKIHIKAGEATPGLVAHEYGHYAAGFVFGHMDTLDFNATECADRSFQETIAPMFRQLFMHHLDRKFGHYCKHKSEAHVKWSKKFKWRGRCGGTDYRMGEPLVQALQETLWDDPWGDKHKTNIAMADAFAYALAENKGHRIDLLADSMLRQIEKTQSSKIATEVATIFNAHGMRGALGDSCGPRGFCRSGFACDKGKSRCTAGRNKAKDGQYCTETKQCSTKSFCPSAGGKCTARLGIGDSCRAGADRCRAGLACDNRKKQCTGGPNEAKVGEFCTDTNQCSTNAFCSSGNKCARRKGIGGSCKAGGDRCKAGLGCDGNKKCFAGANGAADGLYCSQTNQCRSGSYCPSSNSTCRKRLDIGAKCGGDGDCRAGLACDNGKHRCTGGANQAKLGQFCTATNQCPTNAFCSTTNKCTTRLGIGGSCKAGGDRCRAGLGCDSNNKCFAGANGAADGQYCSASNQCKSTSYCPSSNSTCRKRKDLGDSCTRSSDCLSGQACDKGTDRCTAGPNQASVGKYCTNTNQCTTSAYCSSTSGGTCTTKKGIGGSCAAGGDRCQSGLGCDGNKKCFAGSNGASDGQYCSASNQCKSGSYCPSSNSTCRRRADLGDSCNYHSDCRSGQACDKTTSKCTAGHGGAGVGRYCTATNQCVSSAFCSYNKCKTKLNVPNKSYGSSSTYQCKDNSHCKSNYCDYPRKWRCYPAQNKGKTGDFCVSNSNCAVGKKCNFRPGKSWGYCNW